MPEVRGPADRPRQGRRRHGRARAVGETAASWSGSCTSRPRSRPGPMPTPRRYGSEASAALAAVGRSRRPAGQAERPGTPGATSGSGTSPDATIAPSTASSHKARSQPSPVKYWRLVRASEPSRSRSWPAETATGAASWQCSSRAGLGRVRPVQPVETEVPVVGLIPNRLRRPTRGRRGGAGRGRGPPLPDEAALQAVGGLDRCQYSASVPLLLPMACEYSHMISGWCCRPDPAWATSDEMGGYIGQVMSLRSDR